MSDKAIPIFTEAAHDEKCGLVQNAVKDVQEKIIHDRIAGVERRLDEHRLRFDLLEALINANTIALNTQSESTYELIDVMRSAKGFFKVAGWVGSGLKWVLGIATAIGMLWVTLKSGGQR